MILSVDFDWLFHVNIIECLNFIKFYSKNKIKKITWTIFNFDKCTQINISFLFAPLFLLSLYCNNNSFISNFMDWSIPFYVSISCWIIFIFFLFVSPHINSFIFTKSVQSDRYTTTNYYYEYAFWKGDWHVTNFINLNASLLQFHCSLNWQGRYYDTNKNKIESTWNNHKKGKSFYRFGCIQRIYGFNDMEQVCHLWASQSVTVHTNTCNNNCNRSHTPENLSNF